MNREDPSIHNVIIMITCPIILVSGILLIFLKWKYYVKSGRRKVLDVSRDFVTYGLPRGGSTFLDGATLTLVPWLMFDRPDQAGYLLISFTVLRALQSGIMPISQVLSIYLTKQLGQNEEVSIEKSIRTICYAMALISPCATLFLYLSMDFLLSIWLENEEIVEGVRPYLLTLIFAIFPYNLFYAYRGIIDMVWVRPYNIAILALALGVQGLLFYLPAQFNIIINPATAVSSSFLVMGGAPLLGFFKMGYLKGYGLASLLVSLLLIIWIPLIL